LILIFTDPLTKKTPSPPTTTQTPTTQPTTKPVPGKHFNASTRAGAIGILYVITMVGRYICFSF